jgi:hypothetical protein
MPHYIKYLIGVLTVCCVCCPAIAQDSQYVRPYVIGREGGVDGSDCENTMALLDRIAHDARGGGTINIVSTLGRGEASRGLARLRLRNLRGYLRKTRGVEGERIETGEGGRTAGLGKVEIYVGGKLQLVFYMKRNRDFWKGCGV